MLIPWKKAAGETAKQGNPKNPKLGLADTMCFGSA
jgi:hypothetical protein